MASDRVRVICGPGYGKSASALGYAMMGVFRGKRVIMVQFLKGMLGEGAADVLKRLEPDLKFFRFEHSKERFEDLPEDQKHEELMNMRNGFNFARKVMTTGECDVLMRFLESWIRELSRRKNSRVFLSQEMRRLSWS